VLQCVAECCSALLSVAECCSVLQRVAESVSVFECEGVLTVFGCVSMLHGVAAYCSVQCDVRICGLGYIVSECCRI